MLGTVRTRQRTDPPRHADALGQLTLLDDEGREVAVRDLWRERPVALVWLRHYG